MMRKLGRGRIINIASAHGLVGSPFKSAYVAAKHAVVGLTKVTALETAEENITANAICPGYVLTPLVEAQIDAQAAAHGIAREAVIRDVLLAQQPNKKFATVAEIGALTAFLASDAAASITGTALPVDGGWTARIRSLTMANAQSDVAKSVAKTGPDHARPARWRGVGGLSGGGLRGAARGRDRTGLDHRHLDRRDQRRHHRR